MTSIQFLAHIHSARPTTQSITTADWIQTGILLVALYAIVKPHWDKRREKSALKDALLQELLINIDGLFNGGIERPFQYKVFEVFLEKLSSKIKNQSEFNKIIDLYVDLKDFRAVTSRFWPPKDDKDVVAHFQSTQKQVQTINEFLQYFGIKKVKDDYEIDTLVKSRKSAQDIRNKNQKNWHTQLKANIDKML